MKKEVMIILISLCVSYPFNLALGETCPPVRQFPAPTTPPAGWTILIPAIFPGQNYHFARAVHSLNRTYYLLQTLCTYECGPDEKACSPFTILSNSQYRLPTTNTAPWNLQTQLVNTLACAPVDHDPLQCVFSNVPGDQARW